MSKTWRNIAIAAVLIGLAAGTYIVLSTKPSKKQRRKISVINTGI